MFDLGNRIKNISPSFPRFIGGNRIMNSMVIRHRGGFPIGMRMGGMIPSFPMPFISNFPRLMTPFMPLPPFNFHLRANHGLSSRLHHPRYNPSQFRIPPKPRYNQHQHQQTLKPVKLPYNPPLPPQGLSNKNNSNNIIPVTEPSVPIMKTPVPIPQTRLQTNPPIIIPKPLTKPKNSFKPQVTQTPSNPSVEDVKKVQGYYLSKEEFKKTTIQALNPFFVAIDDFTDKIISFRKTQDNPNGVLERATSSDFVMRFYNLLNYIDNLLPSKPEYYLRRNNTIRDHRFPDSTKYFMHIFRQIKDDIENDQSTEEIKAKLSQLVDDIITPHIEDKGDNFKQYNNDKKQALIGMLTAIVNDIQTFDKQTKTALIDCYMTSYKKVGEDYFEQAKQSQADFQKEIDEMLARHKPK